MKLNPVRYPGGKGSNKIVTRILELYGIDFFENKTWIEPFCGGCGLGLSLLERKIIDKCFFNDKDIRILSMWRAMAYSTEQFISNFQSAPITIERFHLAKKLANDVDSSEYIRGFNTYLLNRMCRSGYIDGGAIGGNTQSGQYKIDCRCNKPTLIRNIRYISEMTAQGKIYFNEMPQDATEYLENLGDTVQEAVIYLDPPYYAMGKDCYHQQVDHARLASYLKENSSLIWFLSYDDAPEIRTLYDWCKIDYLDILYSNNNKTRGVSRELLISPPLIN